MILYVHNGEISFSPSGTLAHAPLSPSKEEEEKEKPEPVDALGRPLKIGQVAVHFHVEGHRMGSHPVVIRGFNKTGTIAVDRVNLNNTAWNDEKKKWERQPPCFAKAAVKVPKYLCIVEMTEQQLREQYGIISSS
jgi:hypothetical protein